MGDRIYLTCAIGSNNTALCLDRAGKEIWRPRNLVSRWNLTDVKLRLVGENLLTFYGHQGLDPEQTVSGSTTSPAPARTTRGRCQNTLYFLLTNTLLLLVED